MLAALESVKTGLSANLSAELRGVPPSTLKDRLSGRVKHGRKPGPAPYLTSEEESELSTHLVFLSKMGLGKTRRDVKQIAESVATHKGVMKADKISDGWWRRFLERNPALSLRCGDSTSGVRMDALNHSTINNYFELQKEFMDDFQFEAHPEAIYNIDETGVPLDPRPPKVVAARGQWKIRYRSCGQKSQITVIACGSATGQIISPFIIFATKQHNPLWMEDEIIGTRYAVSDRGWIDQDLFNHWLQQHFLSNSVSHRPILLLLDGHSSHFKPETIRYAKENDVIIFYLLPHTTHECQPLDCSFFRPLKVHWRQACHEFYQKTQAKLYPSSTSAAFSKGHG